MIIAVASRKASPGVTSLTAWLAESWSEPGVTRLIVEADPSGGSLAARWSVAHRLTWDPGLLTLSTSRTPLDAASLPLLTQPLAEGLVVAAAPPAPDQVVGALIRWGDRGATELAGVPAIRAFVDCGRLNASSPALAFALRAALTVLVCRPRLDEVHALVSAVAELTRAGCTLGLVCVGDEPYHPAEIARAAGVELLGVIPVDVRAAAVFDRDGFKSGRIFRRSRLAHTVAELTELVRSRCAEVLVAPDPAAIAVMSSPDVTLPARAVPLRPPVPPDASLRVGPVAGGPVAGGPVAGGPVAGAWPGPTRLSNPVEPFNRPAAIDHRWSPPSAGLTSAEPPPPSEGSREPTRPVLPVSLAVAAARARAQNLAPAEDEGETQQLRWPSVRPNERGRE